ncbi:uncharacterized protein Tco025E_07735 [Trypanosoma conorhini]|uniref:Uncharacterized protein n=1 Tax=Trypanosoma conorhini TaxID=83891 RepID=A0A422NJT9_9TRYP|nr:uncharacterized protein Tco025E_07735 [Trypanosoma conorhini]RNF05736.1 hypothetical protein Tco025E_07735 [Trypanosoma conorhini]
MPFRDAAAALHLPVERTEVLYAVATGDVRLWERRIIRCARDRVAAAASATASSDTVDSRGACTSRDVETPSAADHSQPQQQQQQQPHQTGTAERGGMFSFFWSGSPAAAPTASASATATSEADDRADFSQYTGPNFYTLMELVRGAMRVTTEAGQTDASVPAPTIAPGRMCWSGDLLTALSSLVMFHGSVPAVGRFLGVLLGSYVMAVVSHRCRRDGAAARAPPTERPNANEAGGDAGEADMRIFQSEAFAALIARLAQIYFPLWRSLSGAGEEAARRAETGASAMPPQLLLHTRCVPLPPSHRHPLTIWRGTGGGGDGDNSPAAEPRGLRSRIISSMFNRRSTHRACAGLRLCGDATRAGRLGAARTTEPHAAAKNKRKEATAEDDTDVDEEEGENAAEVPVTLEHVREIVVCVALAELGRLVLFSDVAEAPGGGDPRDSHSLQRGQGTTPAEPAEDASDASWAAYLACVRRGAGASTAERMRDVAAILRAAGDAWRRQLSTGAAASTPEEQAPGRGTHHPRVNSNHCWVTVAVCRVLKCVSQTPWGVCLTSALAPTRHGGLQRPRAAYQEKDFYYMNILLTCLCVAGEQLPPSLAQFALRLMEFNLSDVLLLGRSVGAETPRQQQPLPPPQQTTGGRCTTERAQAGGRGDATDPAVERDGLAAGRARNAEARRRHFAAAALCTTTLKSLRDSYARGSVAPRDTHVRWLSALLRQQVLLWERSLRRAVLLGPHVRSSATSPLDERTYLAQRDAFIAVDPREQPEAVCSLVWWRTRMLLECLCALRDMFAAGVACGLLQDTTAFVAAMRELGRVLQMVCWIDLDAARATPPGARHSETPAAAAEVFPFPVLAATERRFFVGAMLVFGMGAAADALLSFHAWVDRREAAAGDTESGDASGGQEKCAAASSDGGAANARRLWVDDFSLSLLLPSVVRVLQSLAFCVPAESMLPAILRLSHAVEFTSISHVAWAGDQAPRDNFSTCGDGRQDATGAAAGTTAASSACTATPFAACLRVAGEVMALASSVQRVLLSRGLRVLAPAPAHDEALARWMMAPFANNPLPQPGDAAPRCQVLLHIAEGFVLRVPWAGWAAAPACVGAPQSHAVASPAPPPLFAAAYVIATAAALLRLASFAETRPWGPQRLRGAVPLERVRGVLFGAVACVFRGVEDAAFRRACMREELRLRQRQGPRPQDAGKGDGVLSALYYAWDGVVASLSLRTPHESDAARARREDWAAIDAYVDRQHGLLCDDAVGIATALYAVARCPSATATTGGASTLHASLQRLAQHSLESLLPDADVPAAFRLAPLATCRASVVAVPPASDWTPTGLAEFPGATSALLRQLVVSLLPTGQQRDATGPRGWEGPSIEGLLLRQASALVRVMAVVAALTERTTNGEGTAAEAAPKFVLHPAALSFRQWRKLCFALHAMRRAEGGDVALASPTAACRFQHPQSCTENAQEVAPGVQLLQRGQESGEGAAHRCLACCPSVECEEYLRSYVEAGLALVNRSRMDVLICRATTAEERRGLFAVALVLRRAVAVFFAASEPPGTDANANERSGTRPRCGEPCEAHAARRRHPPLPRRQSRREAERAVLLRIAAFAFGVRPLRCAEELLD